MRRQPAARLLRAIAGTTLLVGLVTAPTSAGSGSTLYVDDDGKTGATGCNGNAMGYQEIQAAVDAASPGDTVRVCPGVYPGAVLVSTPDLTIEGVSHWTAVLKRPTVVTVSGGKVPLPLDALLTVTGADGVVVRGLAFAVPAPDEPVAGTCALDSMILVNGDSDGVAIVDNRMRANGPATLGPCGYQNGITYVEGSSGRATDNLVRDFAGEAVSGIGVGTFLVARRNDIRFWHEDAVPPVAPTGGGGCSYGAGLVLLNGARGRLLDNEVVGLASAGTTTPLICPGIYLSEAGDGIVVRGNLVRYAYDGINTAGTNEFTVDDNRFLDSRNDGLLVLGSRRATVEDNQVRRSGARGIVVPVEIMTSAAARLYGTHRTTPAGLPTSANVTFRGNLSVDNVGRDCLDRTVGSRTKGTADTWIGNHSDGNDRPAGICPR